MAYRRGDVRDSGAPHDAFGDAVVHLAFLITGAASGEASRSINVEGTLNACQGDHHLAAAGARRFVDIFLAGA